MARLVAIESDEVDSFSYALLMVNDGVSLDDEHRLYRVWYETSYMPAFRAGQKPEYLTFPGWLVANGKASRFECETWVEP